MKISKKPLKFVKNWARTLAMMSPLAFSSVAFGAQDYAKGHRSLEIFEMQETFTSPTVPTWVKIWLVLLMGSFAVGLFFIRRHSVARWTTIGFVLSSFFFGTFNQILGFPMLGGSLAMMHLIFWTPALIILLKEKPFNNPHKPRPFRVWSGAITAAILFSFMFDIIETYTYLKHWLVNGIV